jgi:tRNA pseudouridine65 synthase/23S rRNA pseudouridine1911/1915/1917 synthase
MYSEPLEIHHVNTVEKPIRLQEYARGIFKTIPNRSGIKKAIKRGQVLIDGKAANTSDWIQEGQVISLFALEKSGKAKIFKLDFPVAFEDDYLAVIHKPAGYPSNGSFFKTIERALPHNLKASKRKDRLPHPVVAHRLDNPTSGLLLIAKTIPVNSQLNLLFENAGVQKRYEALVEGHFPEISKIDISIDGKEAETHIHSREIMSRENKEVTKLQLEPKTGRTHQLRRHLSEKGHPILGDKKYGAKISLKNGIALCATHLGFEHPVTGKALDFEIIPEDRS